MENGPIYFEITDCILRRYITPVYNHGPITPSDTDVVGQPQVTQQCDLVHPAEEISQNQALDTPHQGLRMIIAVYPSTIDIPIHVQAEQNARTIFAEYRSNLTG